SNVTYVNHYTAAQLTNTVSRFFGQNVAFERVFTLKTVSSRFKAFSCPTASFHLRHNNPFRTHVRLVCTITKRPAGKGASILKHLCLKQKHLHPISEFKE